jgi:hypothetical protein
MAGRQLSFFSASARQAQPADVEGMLCGPAQITSRGGAARVSVLVPSSSWRAQALVDALSEAGLAAEVAPGPAGEASIRTAFEPALLPLAEQWAGAGAKRAPHGLVLDGPRLRFWALAAGTPHPAGYLLALGPNDQAVWPAVGSALAAAGLTGVFVGPRADGPAYRITGARRLDRLRELVGEPPDGVPPENWP